MCAPAPNTTNFLAYPPRIYTKSPYPPKEYIIAYRKQLKPQKNHPWIPSTFPLGNVVLSNLKSYGINGCSASPKRAMQATLVKQVCLLIMRMFTSYKSTKRLEILLNNTQKKNTRAKNNIYLYRAFFKPSQSNLLLLCYSFATILLLLSISFSRSCCYS